MMMMMMMVIASVVIIMRNDNGNNDSDAADGGGTSNEGEEEGTVATHACRPSAIIALCVQALCFLAGANSIFDGDKLLTTPNNDRDEDAVMFDALGLKSRPAFLPYESGNESSRHGAAVSASA